MTISKIDIINKVNLDKVYRAIKSEIHRIKSIALPDSYRVVDERLIIIYPQYTQALIEKLESLASSRRNELLEELQEVENAKRKKEAGPEGSTDNKIQGGFNIIN